MRAGAAEFKVLAHERQALALQGIRLSPAKEAIQATSFSFSGITERRARLTRWLSAIGGAALMRDRGRVADVNFTWK